MNWRRLIQSCPPASGYSPPQPAPPVPCGYWHGPWGPDGATCTCGATHQDPERWRCVELVPYGQRDHEGACRPAAQRETSLAQFEPGAEEVEA